MSNIQLNLAFKTACGLGTRKLVLVALADAAHNDGVCWPSTITLARRCDLSRQSVMNALSALEAVGLLSVTRVSGRSNKYRLTLGVKGVDRSTSLTCQRAGRPGVNALDTNHKEPSGEPKVEPQEGLQSQIAKAGKKRTQTSEAASPAQRPTHSQISKADDYPISPCLSKLAGFAEALQDWIENRKDMGKPATVRAIRGLLAKLAERPGVAVDALKEAIMHSWQGFEWEWLDKLNEKFRAAKVYRDPMFMPKPGEKFEVVKPDYFAAMKALRAEKEAREAEECFSF